MEVTGTGEEARAAMIWGKGARMVPEKEKPKRASRMWSVSCMAWGKSVVNGMERLWSCVAKRLGSISLGIF